MARIYERPRSPYWWVKYRDEKGHTIQESTKCRAVTENGKRHVEGTRQAKQIAAERSLAELKRGQTLEKKVGWAWVPEFLQSRYQENPGTLVRYTTAWTTLRLFLETKELIYANQFLREHCYQFVKWRQNPDNGKGLYRAGHNTALLEIKLMRIIMHEAMLRGMVTGNPCVKLGLKRAPQKVKSELSHDDCVLIRAEIAKLDAGPVKEMMHLSFEIGRHQGCRLMETQINPLTDVTLSKAGNTITFRQKGGRDFTTLLHPELVPIFQELKASKRTYTWKTPEGRHPVWASSKWWKFMHKLGLKEKGICFHSNRVTVVTELVRGNVHESKAQNFVGHASTTVHRIYQRLRPPDLQECVSAVAGKHPKS